MKAVKMAEIVLGRRRWRQSRKVLVDMLGLTDHLFGIWEIPGNRKTDGVR